MKNNTIRAALGLLAALIFVPSVHAQTTDWLWSAKAPLVNRSTEALASGHPERALRFARQARAKAGRAADRLIAAHNLCLALITRTNADAGDEHCRTAVHEARALPAGQDALPRIRGALVTGAPFETGDAILSLSRVVRDNIARAYGARLVDHIALLQSDH
jgi:hypothetical protein